MKQLKFNELGQTEVPDGYKWCHECGALTPHNPEKGYGRSSRCMVCDCYKTGILECPNCGCDEEEDYASSYTVVRHHKGCHRDSGDRIYSHAHNVLHEFKRDFMRPAPDRGTYSLPRDQEWYGHNKKLRKIISDHDKRFECGCPRFEVFRCINQVVIEGNSYASMDCSNAHWWRYQVRCPICGLIYEGEGDSC